MIEIVFDTVEELDSFHAYCYGTTIKTKVSLRRPDARIKLETPGECTKTEPDHATASLSATSGTVAATPDNFEKCDQRESLPLLVEIKRENDVDDLDVDEDHWQAIANQDNEYGVSVADDPLLCATIASDEITFVDTGAAEMQDSTTAPKTKRKSNGIRPKKQLNMYRVRCHMKNCKQSFESKGAMWYHKKFYHGKNNMKSWQCHLCKMQYRHKQKLQLHMDGRHTGDTKFRCSFPMCRKRFTRKIGLQQHINAWHTRNELYQCTECSKSYYQLGHAKRHIALKHGTLDTCDRYVIVFEE